MGSNSIDFFHMRLKIPIANDRTHFGMLYKFSMNMPLSA
jgi:hypothetical protein